MKRGYILAIGGAGFSKQYFLEKKQFVMRGFQLS